MPKLKPGDMLFLVPEPQNPVDPNAMMLQTEDHIGVGYCPRYLLDDVLNIVGKCCGEPQVKIERVNPAPAPLQYRLLCNLTACWPNDFHPFDTEKYQPIVKGNSLTI